MTALEEKGKSVTLLICEDEPSMVELLTRMMEPISSRIDHVDTLEECLIKADQVPYNLIIMDLRLKYTDKADALSAIRVLKRRQKHGIVVVSGIPDEGLREEVLDAGADAFVPKGRTPLTRSLMIAAHVALLHMPEDVQKSPSFTQHVQMLAKMAAA